jgi:hypothetical protein
MTKRIALILTVLTLSIAARAAFGPSDEKQLLLTEQTAVDLDQAEGMQQ